MSFGQSQSSRTQPMLNNLPPPGEIYLSDLTLAFLEDTNQYVANYSYAGAITPSASSDEMVLGVLPFRSKAVRQDPGKGVANGTLGALRWGSGGGCR